ncbi:efflux RND transporter periplasmic adaptor subunit [Echinimonas agarilytica]|uniref:Efflux RND transporter periplasmic adaptor subunit n=1 Tax=Echinimonas agarilytica TaxID=1215918 RepID=A0AA42B8C9_9GAMM|nr:efflux RND transporter periplasmic adaptor subunit [Echinimonas agarilytica]MCM2680363.1 efflux RND transporter periplasmic adaptor subunit [Echinimonas agarilytica]
MNTKWMKVILPIAAIGFGVAGFMTINATAAKPEDIAVVDTRPTVKVLSATAQDYQVTISSFGEVRPLESTMLAPQVSGEVVSWNPKLTAGGLVERGEVLFSIEKDNYEAALLQAEANLSQAQAALIEENAQAKVAEAEAKRLKDRTVSDLYLRKPQVMSAKATVLSAVAALKLARRDLENCDIKAPYDALVISRDLGVGQFVSAGDVVAELNSIEAAEIVFPIPGFDNPFLPDNIADLAATVTTQGFNGFTRSGVITRDLGIVDNATRMSHLVARIEDPYSLNTDAPRLKFGSYVEVAIAGRQLSNVYQVPQKLVSNRTVWTVNGDDELHPKKVEVLREEGEFFLIGSGIEESDQIVLTLPEYPQKGMQVISVPAETQVAQR